MRFRIWALIGAAGVTGAASAARAQVAPTTPAPARTPSRAAPAATDEEEPIGQEIEVVGIRNRDAVPGNIQPEVQLSPADIRSFGVSSVSDLLTELGPQVRSDQGRGGAPVVLLNGRRISGFGEIRDLPTEAIERVDILPEEAALRLGYRADARVVNIVLRRRFRAITGEVQGGGATDGGRFSAAADANVLRIARDKRLTVNLHYDGATALHENDRDILPTQTGLPYSIAGNVTPVFGATQIDPALSALAGRTVTVAGIPTGLTARPALGAFLAGANPYDNAPYRTIAPATRNLSANATYARTIGKVSAALNTSFAATTTGSELGLGTASLTLPATNPFSPFTNAVVIDRYLVEAGPRLRRVDGNTGHVGLVLNGDVGDWRWSFTGNYDRNFSRTLSDTGVDLSPFTARIAALDPTLNPFAQLAGIGGYRSDYARSIASVANYEMVASGTLVSVPAGKVALSLKSGFETSDFAASAIRSGVTTASSLGRNTGSVQASVDVPLTSRRNDFGAALGNLSVNGNYALDKLSDYGALRTIGYGFNWAPVEAIRLLATVTDQDGAPTVAQLGNPVVVTPDSRTFDFANGTSVDVTRIDGGNRALLADDRRVTKLALTLKPLAKEDLTFTANYLRTRTLNPIASFPAATAAIEAAFPDRFTRDASGRLTRIDARPVNFQRRDEEELRWGVNFSHRIGKAPPPRPQGFGGFRQRAQTPPADTPAPGGEAPAPAQSAAESSAPPPPQRAPGGGGFGGGGFGNGGGGGRRGFGGGFAGGGGRLQVALYHTWHFEDSIQVRPGVPTLDLLNGAAITSRGGQPRHELELQTGVTRNGLGARISANWQSGTFVTGGTPTAPTDLRFAGLTTATLRLFANFTPLMKVVREHRWLRGTRVTFTVQNVFDARLRVTDPTGAVPLNYQPDLLDPIGRTVRIGIRKLFF